MYWALLHGCQIGTRNPPKIDRRQEVSKIDQKSHRKQNASWLGIWKPLGTIFGGFRLQVGRQVDAKLVPKSKNEGPKAMSQKSSKKMETRVATPGRLSGPLKYSDPDY